MCLQAELVSYSQKFAMTPSACCGRAFIYEGDVPLCKMQAARAPLSSQDACGSTDIPAHRMSVTLRHFTGLRPSFASRLSLAHTQGACRNRKMSSTSAQVRDELVQTWQPILTPHDEG